MVGIPLEGERGRNRRGDDDSSSLSLFIRGLNVQLVMPSYSPPQKQQEIPSFFVLLLMFLLRDSTAVCCIVTGVLYDVSQAGIEGCDRIPTSLSTRPRSPSFPLISVTVLQNINTILCLFISPKSSINDILSVLRNVFLGCRMSGNYSDPPPSNF